MRIIVNVIRMITIKRKVNFVIKKKSIGDITTITIMHIQMKAIIMLKKQKVI